MKIFIKIICLSVFALCACSLTKNEQQDIQIIEVGCQLIIPADQGVTIPPNSKLMIGRSDCHE